MKHLLIPILLILASCKAPLESPTILRNFSEPASPEEVIEFVLQAAQKTKFLEAQIIGESVEGNPLIMAKTNSRNQTEPLRVLIFAQQHGNEQSGKEAALLLIRDLANHLRKDWLRAMEIWIVPQVNPDGGRRNERRNGSGLDLNRDHLLLQAPETRALHSLFREFQPHVTIDMHEYQPYRPSWEEFGGTKTFDVQVGIPTNINVSENIRAFAGEKVLPAIEEHLKEQGFSFHNYLVGPVPTEGRTRHSTVDFNDGRQSFAILNTLSFIVEGINGRDGYTDQLERRTIGQSEALKALLDYLYRNNAGVKSLIQSAREELKSAQGGETVSIRMEHLPDGSILELPLLSSKTGMDTLVIVENFHPLVQSTYDISRPKAYLVPTSDSLLSRFLEMHHIDFELFHPDPAQHVSAYSLDSILTSNDEEINNHFAQVKQQSLRAEDLSELYYMVPTNQLHSNFLVMVFEPQSMFGLVQLEEYRHLIKAGGYYPILRIE
jgi:hypothetical protein